MEFMKITYMNGKTRKILSPDQYQLHYAAQGCCHYLAGEDDFLLKEGDMVLTAPGNAAVMQRENGASCLCLLTDVEPLEETLARVMKDEPGIMETLLYAMQTNELRGSLILSTEQDPAFRTLMSSIYREWSGTERYREQILRIKMAEFCLMLLRIGERSIIIPATGNRTRDRQMFLVISAIQNEYATVTLTGVAEEIGYSTRQLQRLVKEYTGQNFQQLLQGQRMKVACRLLSDSGMSMEEIARHTGYSDAGNFSRAFRRKTGMTPQDYRSGRLSENSC